MGQVSRRTIPWLACALGVGLLAAPRLASAAEIDWKGYTWTVTNGGMAGVAPGSTANVSVDASGYLHLKIQKNGDAWSAAEIFTTAKLGFGTYQWQIDGPIDTLDKNVVLGLFPYGPAAGIGNDATNEIDIEYSRWGDANGPNGDWTNYPASGSTIGELSYTFSLSGGTLSTSRFIWTKSSIEDFLFAGLQDPSSSASLIKSWKYSPANASVNIPQQALPLGMNLWCFGIPSDGKNVEIVVRDFQFLPEGASAGGAGTGGAGGAGTGGAVGAGGAAAAGGAGAAGASSASGGSVNAGGASSGAGDTSGAGGTSSSGAASISGAASVIGGSGPLSGGASAVSSAGAATVASGASSGCSVSRSSAPRSAPLGLFALLLSLPLSLRLRRSSRIRTRWAR